MPKINLIIWSKDRACQLDLLLRSILENAPDIFETSIIYKASTPEFRAGYDRLDKQYGKKFDFVDEDGTPARNLHDLTLELVEYKDNDLICFSTDDMVFHGKATMPPKLESKYSVFSFRLGFNTIEQDIHSGTKQPPLNHYVENNGILTWNPQLYHPHSNYGYPLALDTHVFHRGFILPLMQAFAWKNTNELESGLHKCIGQVYTMSSFTESVAVNIPCNSMSGVTTTGQMYAYSAEELNEKLLSSQRISLASVMQEKVIGCHQEVEYVFEAAN